MRARGRAPRLPTYVREQDRATRKLRPFEDVQPQSAGVEGSPRPLVGDDIDRTGAADGRGKLLPIANAFDGASQIKVVRKAGAFEGDEIITGAHVVGDPPGEIFDVIAFVVALPDGPGLVGQYRGGGECHDRDGEARPARRCGPEPDGARD